MSTEPSPQNATVPPEAAPDAGDTAEASASAVPEQIYDEAILRLAVITEEWQQARNALRGG